MKIRQYYSVEVPPKNALITAQYKMTEMKESHYVTTLPSVEYA